VRGADLQDSYRQATTIHSDWMFKGEKPTDLPVRSRKFEIGITLKTAKLRQMTG
jgi:hypothetical protein